VIIGVAAFQGACREHSAHLRQRGWQERRVIKGEDLEGLDGLIFPGGESTVMKRFFAERDFQRSFDSWRKTNRPVWGVCAGAILLSKTIDGGENPLGLADVSIERNAYGRHRESGYRTVTFFDGTVMEGLFIRAPRISATGQGLSIIAHAGKDPVVVRHGSVWLTTWHPELDEASGLYDMIFG